MNSKPLGSLSEVGVDMHFIAVVIRQKKSYSPFHDTLNEGSGLLSKIEIEHRAKLLRR